MKYNIILAILFIFLLSNTLFAQVNLSNGLVAYYPFNGNANDASGNGNNAIFNNATLTLDRFGNSNSAYHFNGIDNYIQIPNSPSINPDNQISLCVYIRPTGFYKGPCHGNSILVKADADFLPGNYALRFDDNAYTFGNNCNTSIVDTIHQNFYGVSAQTPSPGYTPYINKDQWYCVVFTYDGSSAKFYVDGSLLYTQSQPGLTFSNNYDLFLGNLNNAAFPYWLNGDLDEVRIYNRAINDQEVKALCTTNTDSVIINDYTPVISFDVCKNQILVQDATKYNIGDTVLLIQMKGAVIDSTNSSSFGTITDYKNAGNYEFNYVKSKTGNTIDLKNKVTRQYDVLNGKVQLIRVPYYNSYNITKTLTCLPWDGSKGGVLVLNAKDSIYLNADINVSGKGFSGGNSPNPNTTTLYCNYNDYYYSSGSVWAAAKGESISNIGDEIAWGKGASANAGGGGSGHNSGGGGGSNGGAGGFGGYQLDACGGSATDNRGLGGKALSYSNSPNKIFMGGGGGSGQTDNAGGSPMNGGNGGGIIIIKSPVILNEGTYNVIAQGGDAPECTLSPIDLCHDGNGGGGGGGTILIENSKVINSTNINVNGGKGADLVVYYQPNAGKIGTGAGGGAGMFWSNSSSLPVNVLTTETGGTNGVILPENNDTYGATPGNNGLNLFNLKIPIDTILFKPNIDSVRFKDSVTSCSSFDFKGFGFTNTSAIASWQWNFGDTYTSTAQNTSHTYANAGTYTVKLVATDMNGCKDSITKTVSPLSGNNYDFSYEQNVCNPLSVQFTSNDLTANNNWTFGDGSAINNTSNPVHMYTTPGNYIISFTSQSGCKDTIVKQITLNILPADIIVTKDTTICTGSIKQLQTIPSLSFCWSPTTYLNNPLLPNPVTSSPENITYYFTAEIPGVNIIANGNFNSGNSGFISDYVYANPNITEGQYYVGSSAQAWNASLSNCSDHTTGNGNMLLVNGSPEANVKVWSETVTVLPNTNYAFSTWIQALYPPNPAQLSFSINGSDIGNLITASLPTCTWTQFYTTWNSGNNTSAAISIINKNTFVQGNDFALDDISFSQVSIKKDSVKITIDTPFIKVSNDTLVCEGSKVQLIAIGSSMYTWVPATGLSNPSTANPVATVTAAETYIATGTDNFGCIAKDSVKISINPVPAIIISNDTTICNNTTLKLFITGGKSYTWSPSSSLDNASSADPVASPVVSTLYKVAVTDSYSCIYNDSVKVNIRPAAVFTISNDSSVCITSSKQLIATGGDNYTWSPSSSLDNASSADPVASPAATTTYSVIIRENVCNETATLSTTLTVLPLPEIHAASSNDLTCSLGFSQLTASGASVYNWLPAAGLSSTIISNPVATPSISTIYQVMGKDNNGCTGSDTVTVKADYNKNALYLLPNSFTPNGDGLNDCFGVKNWGNVTDLELSIYNRFGQRVFYTNDASKCWDGTYKQHPQDADVFVYTVTAKTACGLVNKKGNVTLMR